VGSSSASHQWPSLCSQPFFYNFLHILWETLRRSMQASFDYNKTAKKSQIFQNKRLLQKDCVNSTLITSLLRVSVFWRVVAFCSTFSTYEANSDQTTPIWIGRILQIDHQRPLFCYDISGFWGQLQIDHRSKLRRLFSVKEHWRHVSLFCFVFCLHSRPNFEALPCFDIIYIFLLY
jgi:hypothetical protein